MDYNIAMKTIQYRYNTISNKAWIDQMAARTTISDVAKQAGVSVGTVSRVLNHTGNCDPKRLKRIEEAIRELNYVPNLNARATRTVKSNCIGILIERRSTENNFWLQSLLESLLQCIGQTRFHSYLQVVDSRADLNPVMRLLGNTDGVILIGRFEMDFFNTMERSFPVPTVTYWEPMPYANGCSLAVNLDSGIRQLTEHLLALGHRSIGVIGNARGVDVEKVEIFLRHIRAYQPDYPESLIACEAVSDRYHRAGAELTGRLLDRHPELTALFFLSDSFVLGGYGELNRRRLTVPDDVSLVGFDNSCLAGSMVPELTSVGFNFNTLAALLVCRLVAFIRPEEPPPMFGSSQDIVLEFHPRGSTGKAVSVPSRLFRENNP